jgi:uncharacterized membrane protein (GlpM family)
MRGTVVASLSVVVAAFSHVAGGGAAPGALGVILASTFSVLACIAVGSRPASPLRTTISVGLSQIVFHLVFSLGAHLPGDATSTGSGDMLGMVMSGGRTPHLPDLSTPGALSAAATDDVRMWLGHALAAVVTILVLLHGERALLTVVRLGAARLLRLAIVSEALPAALGVARHVVVTALGDLRGVPSLDLLLASRPYRGPPLAL